MRQTGTTPAAIHRRLDPARATELVTFVQRSAMIHGRDQDCVSAAKN